MSEKSTMIPLGTKAPDFHLKDTVTNKMMSLQDLKSNHATVIMFICNHCPYVKLIQEKLLEITKHYQAKGISFIAICSNDSQQYPEDSPEQMGKMAQALQYTFPYLHDETQAIAKAYQAACTPDFYIFDKDLLCVYRGRFDEATPGNNKTVTGADISAALDAILSGKKITDNQIASVGCSIKWKKNNILKTKIVS